MVSRSSSGEKRRAARIVVGAPPWSKAERDRLVARVRQAATTRAHRLDVAPLGPMSEFVGYDGAALVEHLERRHAQGCLICGADLAPDEVFEICHIDPLHDAEDGATLAALMALTNIGLAHVACNVRLGPRPLR